MLHSINDQKFGSKKILICMILFCGLIYICQQFYTDYFISDMGSNSKNISSYNIRIFESKHNFLPILNQENVSKTSLKQNKVNNTDKKYGRYGPTIGYLVDSPKCKIPDIDPFDSSILKFVKEPEKLNCHIFNDVTKTKGNVLLFFPKKLPEKFHHQFADEKDKFPNFSKEKKSIQNSSEEINCCYKAVYRITQSLKKYNKNCDEKNRYGDKCFPILQEKQVVPFDIIKVECRAKKNLIYSNAHALVDTKKLLKSLSKRNDTEENPVNVIVFGMDSVSRLNMHRTLPLTVKYLKEELNAFEFYGYNKVGDNSVPNLFPFLSGKSAPELRKHCIADKRPKVYDKCNPHLIWSQFKKKGYFTTFMEDYPYTSLFNYPNVDGFVLPPTDNYGRPYILETRKLKRNNDYCLGNKLGIEISHDYSVELMTALKDYPTFSFFYTSQIAHNKLNNPKLADKPHANYLKRLKQNGILNNTILFFISDHGIRFGDIRSTYVGALEERLPMFHIVLPDWFEKKYPLSYANMKLNTNKLTSHFDTYETFIDILHSTYEQPTNYRSKRGISMFNNIPTERSCKEAGIPDNYCTCHEMKPLATTEKYVITGAIFAMDEINNKLMEHPKCLPFKEISVSKAFVGSWTHKIALKTSTKLMMVQMTLNPGKANFEVTIKRFDTGKEKFKIIGDILRINTYSNQINCTSDALLRYFCVCNL